MAKRIPEHPDGSPPSALSYLVGVALLIVGLVTASALYYRFEVERARIEAVELLGTIADAKAERIVQWRAERIGDIENIARQALFVRDLEGWLSAANPRSSTAPWQQALALTVQSYGYDNALVVRADRTPIYAVDETDARFSPETVEALRQALSEGQPVHSQPYRSNSGKVFVDTCAPIKADDGGILAALIIRSDANTFLFPLSDSWPTPSESGETLLFRRSGSDVLFLNNLRKAKDPALTTRLPVSLDDLPAARALRDEGRLVSGIDYRNQEVVAVASDITGSDWKLLAKIDSAEIFAGVRYRLAVALAGTIFVSLLLLVAILFLYNRKRSVFFQDLYEIERKLRESEMRFQAVFEDSHAVMLMIDPSDGTIVEANPAAATFYGWPQDKLRTMTIFDLNNAPTEQVQANLEKALHERQRHFTSRHRRRDGAIRDVDIFSGPLQLHDRDLLYSIIFDVTRRQRAERELRRNEQLLRMAGRAARFGAWSVDIPDFHITWSDEVCAIHEVPAGYSPEIEEAINFYAPEWRETVQNKFDQCVNEGKPFEFEVELVTAKKNRVWVQSIGEAERDASGRIVCVRGAFQDISDRKRREEEFATLIQASLDGFWRCDNEGNLLDANEALNRMLGYSRDDLLEMNVADLAVPDNVLGPQFMARVFQTGAERTETQFGTKSGQFVDVEISCRYLPVLGPRIYAFVRDITEQRRHERLIADERNRYRTIFEAAPISIWEEDWSMVLPYVEQARASGTDDYGTYYEEHPELVQEALRAVEILDVNQATVTLLNASDKAALLASLEVVFATEDTLSGFIGELVALSEGKTVYETEMKLNTVDGDAVDVLLHMTLPDAGAESGRLFVTLTDISQRKRHEAEVRHALRETKRSNEELEQFAYVASHDLQEPLRMVASYTELLSRRYKGTLDERADKYIHYAMDGALRMQQLINDLLLYSRVNTRAREPELTNAETALGKAIQNLQTAIEQSGADITYDALPEVFAEPVQLGQLFQNLISNAIKFRQPDVEPRIHISVEDLENEWQFVVNDNGIGIDEKYAPKVFAIFQRLHTREEYPGTGIGLAVCKRIVERQGGSINFTSTVGEGTSFVFTLPKHSGDA